MGVIPRQKASTPRLSHGPSNETWMVEAMLDLPDRGTPFNTTMRPASVTPNISAQIDHQHHCRVGGLEVATLRRSDEHPTPHSPHEVRGEGLPAWGLSWRGYGSATRSARIAKRPEWSRCAWPGRWRQARRRGQPPARSLRAVEFPSA